MYFRSTFRHNPATGKSDWYYSLVESYRNAIDEVRQRTVLTVGFMCDFSGEQIDQIQVGINSKVLGQERLFEDEQVSAFVEQLYVRILKNKKVDIAGTNVSAQMRVEFV